jgi:hypothetical protein
MPRLLGRDTTKHEKGQVEGGSCSEGGIVAISTNSTGLTPNATYHYRLVATNNVGTTY